MKYFGEYLVSKGILKEENLVSALIEQMQSTPSIADVVFSKKALSSSLILQALKSQYENKIDFKQACIQLSVWTDEIETIVMHEMKSKKVPLGHILVKKGYSDLSTITKALDDFLSRKEAPSEAPPEKKLEPTIVGVPVASKESAIDSVLLDEFLTNLSDEKLNSIKKQNEILTAQGTDFAPQKQAMKILLAEIHFIRGLMKCIRIDQFESLFSLLETLCLKLIERIDLDGVKNLPVFSELVAANIDLLSELKVVLAKTSNEAAWFQVDVQRDRFNALFSRVTDTCFGVA